MELAGAELLGRDVARICSLAVLLKAQALLQSEPNLERLLNQMIQSSTFMEDATRTERALNSISERIFEARVT